MLYLIVCKTHNGDNVLESHLQDDLFDLIEKQCKASNSVLPSHIHFTRGVKHFPLGTLDVVSFTDRLQR